jgi:ABC-type bacteriocin/lantibiotic exporter with double-glycine peptidase domain
MNIEYKPSFTNRLTVIKGSYIVRCSITSHPLMGIDTEFEIYLGILEEGEFIDGCCLCGKDSQTLVRLVLSSTNINSQLTIAESQAPDTYNSILSINGMVEEMVTDDSRYTKRLDDHPTSLLTRNDVGKELVSDFYMVPRSSLIIKSEGQNQLFSRKVYVRTSSQDTAFLMLPASVVILPKSLRFFLEKSQTLQTVLSNEEIPQEQAFLAVINLLTSLHLALLHYKQSKACRQKQNRLNALGQSEQILSDYAGRLQISVESKPSGEISNSLLKDLFHYLNELGINPSSLTYPDRFDSADPLKQVEQILNLSYIPIRIFTSGCSLSSRVIGSFVRFQGQAYELHIPKLLRVSKYGGSQILDSMSSAQYLQIFRPLSADVSAWEFLGCMLHGTYADLGIVIATSLLTALITLLPPIVITYLLSEIIPYSATKPFIEIIILLLVAGIVTFVLQLLQSRYAVRLEAKADINLQTAVTNRLLQLPASAILAEDSGDLQSRVSYLSQLRSVFTQTITPLLTQTLTLLFNFCLLFWYSWPVALLSLIPLLILILSATYVGIVKGQFYKLILENDGRIFAGLFRYLLGVVPFRTNLCTDFVRSRYLSVARPLIVFLFRATRQGDRLNVLDVAIRPLTYCFIFPVIVWSIQSNVSSAISVASFAGFSTALTTIFNSGRSLTDNTLGQLVQGWAIWQRSLEFLRIPTEATRSKVSLINISGRIEFRNVSFAYKKSLFPVLSGISFVIEEGEFIGITGESGCGKSTLMRLAYAVLSPSEGSVIYDTHNSDQFNQRSLRSNFGVITQDVRLLNASLRDNIICGTNHSDQQLAEILETACLTEFVSSLPMGLETMLSERSGMISMGQKQLIIVARALLRNPIVLFMDEATSYLDQNTESRLTANIKSMGITRLAVAHRLSSIIEADRILYLHQGRIVGFDSHKNLLRDVPAYHSLYTAYSDS